jgi:hypothetical protein
MATLHVDHIPYMVVSVVASTCSFALLPKRNIRTSQCYLISYLRRREFLPSHRRRPMAFADAESAGDQLKRLLASSRFQVALVARLFYPRTVMTLPLCADNSLVNMSYPENQ